MNVFDILDKLEATSGSNAKIAILREHKDNRELVFLLDAALNFKRKFFIKQLDPIVSPNPSNKVSITAFADLLAALQNRSVTGNDAKRWASSLISDCNPSQQKWFQRVLLKDLKCGFGISSCVKAGINIPEFEVMLAKDGKECKNLEVLVKQGVYVSPKLDGYRCLAVCRDGEVSLYSRSGTEYENFVSIAGSLAALCEDSSFVLDGEIMSDDFNAMQQTAFASKRGTVVGDVVYNVFGWIAIDEWDGANFKTPTKQRLDNLDLLFETKINGFFDNIKQVRQDLVYRVEDILRLEQEYLKSGYEGAMALPNVPYYLGKKTNKLMKFKTMLSQDCRWIAAYEGTGKYQGSLGGMSVIQENGEKCDVGSGFTDEDRAYIWANPNEFVDRIVEVKYQELTPDGVMRFPIFLRFRDLNSESGKI